MRISKISIDMGNGIVQWVFLVFSSWICCHSPKKKSFLWKHTMIQCMLWLLKQHRMRRIKKVSAQTKKWDFWNDGWKSVRITAMAAGNVVGGSLSIASGWQLVLATFKNLPYERVPCECSQSRYIADIFIKDIFLDFLPIYCRYIAVSDVAACSFKRSWYVLFISQWGAMEYLLPHTLYLIQTLNPKWSSLSAGM